MSWGWRRRNSRDDEGKRELARERYKEEERVCWVKNEFSFKNLDFIACLRISKIYGFDVSSHICLKIVRIYKIIFDHLILINIPSITVVS